MSKEKYKQYAGLTVRPLIYPPALPPHHRRMWEQDKTYYDRQKQLLSQEKKVKNETNN
jgi:hypothetical protein